MRRLVWWVAALVLASVAWWTYLARARSREAVVDLVARLPEATFSEGSPYRAWPVAAMPADDPRDAGVFLRIPAGTWIEWRDLGLHAPVRLDFGLGETTDAPPDEAAEAHLEITLRFDDGEVGRSLPLRRGPSAPPKAEFLLVDRPGEARLRSVRFEVTTDDGRPATWPAVFAPVVRGSRLDPDPWSRPVERRVTAFDFVARAGTARVLEQPEDAPFGRTRVDPLPGVPGKGGPRVGLRLAPRTRVRFPLPKGATGRLSLAAALEPSEGAAPVRLEVLAGGARLLSRTLDPRTNPGDRGWVPLAADLPPAADTIEFLVDGGKGGGPAAILAPCTIERTELVDRLAQDEAPNVLVLLVDTLRADAVDPTNAPHLCELALRGVRFDRSRTFTSWTWPSVATLLTGLHPLTHGVHERSGFLLSQDHETIAERFARRGYTTGAVVTNVLLGAADGFDQGFETYVHVPFARARSVNELALRFVDATAGKARFLWLHYLDPHHPYRPPDPWFDELEPTPEEEEVRRRAAAKWPDASDPDVRRAVEWERRRYLAEVRYLDGAIGELLDALSERGFLDDALVVLVSDHGEEFLEHGQVRHGGHLYAESLDVPLIVASFGDRALPPAPKRDLAAAAGLPATLLHLADGSPSADTSLWPSWFDSREPPAFVGYTDHGLVEGVEGFVDAFSLVARRGGALLEAIWVPAADRVELYDFALDPNETTDLAPHRPGLAREMVERLRREIERLRAGAPGGSGAVDEDARRRLEEMGYVGSGG